MSNKLLIKKGDRFSYLSILKETKKHSTKGGTLIRKFICECNCGKICNVLLTNLRSGKHKSCGCLRDSILQSSPKTHGKTGTKIYNCYMSIKQRCNNKNAQAYKYYGGRGIKCEWNSFEEFYKDMGSLYDKHYKDNKGNTSIERINVNGNYCKENCRWDTSRMQARNKRNSSILTYNGKTMCLAEWCEQLGVSKIYK